jgi:hypothetical protein
MSISDVNSTRERERLIEILIEDGYISPDQKTVNLDKVSRVTVNDEIFWESLEVLSKCRDLLTLEEEQYINNLATRFKHLR